MTNSHTALALTALSIGFLHTLFGPDHYIPFVAMAKAGRWSMLKTIVITALCGAAHVGGSAILGLIGVCVGVAVTKLTHIEVVRGAIAGWLLLAFGLVYFIWGLRAAIRNRPHTHRHIHADGTVHDHEHVHNGQHLHVHSVESESTTAAMRPWILFTIFLFGPCEPLIPLVMYPAAQGHYADVIWVTLLFGAVTIATMELVVTVMCLGMEFVPAANLSRYGHAMAGLAILACGVAVNLGL